MRRNTLSAAIFTVMALLAAPTAQAGIFGVDSDDTPAKRSTWRVQRDYSPRLDGRALRWYREFLRDAYHAYLSAPTASNGRQVGAVVEILFHGSSDRHHTAEELADFRAFRTALNLAIGYPVVSRLNHRATDQYLAARAAARQDLVRFGGVRTENRERLAEAKETVRRRLSAFDAAMDIWLTGGPQAD